ncbi:hypothetical protein OG989_06130 [Micromonospora sp. NBC_01740]|uniref:hypothetical protein n=1 Tax=Micromonospora sp. NBC_01740 TaxID=2975986 RepID=UPI002E12F981|nr:hypothetical protein OG989_06130 [Micromonospora sp. NBC_01740]
MARHSSPGGGTLCFHPADENGELMARQSPSGGTLCFHPADKGDEPVARNVWPGGGGGAACFHPGDGDGAPTARLADDLAADLHLALTGIDDRQLALLG